MNNYGMQRGSVEVYIETFSVNIVYGRYQN